MSEPPTLLAQAQQALTTQLAALPASRTHAAVFVGTEDGIRFGYVQRIDRETWELKLAAQGGYSKAEGWNAGAQVLLAWGGSK